MDHMEWEQGNILALHQYEGRLERNSENFNYLCFIKVLRTQQKSVFERCNSVWEDHSLACAAKD